MQHFCCTKKSLNFGEETTQYFQTMALHKFRDEAARKGIFCDQLGNSLLRSVEKRLTHQPKGVVNRNEDVNGVN